MQRLGAWIHGIGMTTPLGLQAAATAAAIRAGLSRIRESSFMNRRGRPMILSHLRDEHLPPLTQGLARRQELTSRQIRMLRLATHALQEALSPLQDAEGIPLLLVGPEPYPGQPPALENSFLDHLRAQTNAPLSRERSSVFPGGRAGGLEAIEAALKLLHERGFRYVLVGGVDSHVDADVLGLLDHDGRVHAEEVVDGFVPGEAAAFLLLSSRKQLPTSSALAYLSAPGIGQEQGHRYSDQPYLGNGLADAVRAATQGLPPRSIRTVFASLNGESFGAKEWGIAAIRNSDALREEFQMEHPADCFGDLGAAIGPVLIGLATFGLRKGYAPGPSLIWCASEGSPRAALLVGSEPV